MVEPKQISTKLEKRAQDTISNAPTYQRAIELEKRALEMVKSVQEASSSTNVGPVGKFMVAVIGGSLSCQVNKQKSTLIRLAYGDLVTQFGVAPQSLDVIGLNPIHVAISNSFPVVEKLLGDVLVITDSAFAASYQSDTGYVLSNKNAIGAIGALPHELNNRTFNRKFDQVSLRTAMAMAGAGVNFDASYELRSETFALLADAIHAPETFSMFVSGTSNADAAGLKRLDNQAAIRVLNAIGKSADSMFSKDVFDDPAALEIAKEVLSGWLSQGKNKLLDLQEKMGFPAFKKENKELIGKNLAELSMGLQMAQEQTEDFVDNCAPRLAKFIPEITAGIGEMKENLDRFIEYAQKSITSAKD